MANISGQMVADSIVRSLQASTKDAERVAMYAAGKGVASPGTQVVQATNVANFLARKLDSTYQRLLDFDGGGMPALTAAAHVMDAMEVLAAARGTFHDGGGIDDAIRGGVGILERDAAERATPLFEQVAPHLKNAELHLTVPGLSDFL
ncbi:MAG: hypothetical protein JWO69_379 [Thermoleophilia bacterium]|jgi:hypothetical protein|nr:hypothetical protein [Thermoleophilia bacterium]